MDAELAAMSQSLNILCIADNFYLIKFLSNIEAKHPFYCAQDVESIVEKDYFGEGDDDDNNDTPFVGPAPPGGLKIKKLIQEYQYC